MRFTDRVDAGQRLAARLAAYDNPKPIILALPRGGVAVAAEVAAALDAPLDIILVRKIGAPMQPELTLGVVVDGREPIITRNPYVMESTATTEEEFKALCRGELAEIERRRQRYVGHRQPVDVTGRAAIIVDDGIATGATARGALQATRTRKPKKLVLAVPRQLKSLRRSALKLTRLSVSEKWGPSERSVIATTISANSPTTTSSRLLPVFTRAKPSTSGTSAPMKCARSWATSTTPKCRKF
jgi:predicted phosphoribosyltransferase